MSARSRMIMRAVWKRNTQANRNTHGHKKPTNLTTVDPALSCFLYSKRSRREVDGDKFATVEDLRMMIPWGTDMRPGDIITAVTDRNGGVIHDTTLRVQGVQKRFSSTRHYEVIFEDVNQVQTSGP